MVAIEQQSLFSWKDVEARSDLERFFLVRDHLPDEQLMHYLGENRGPRLANRPLRIRLLGGMGRAGEAPALTRLDFITYHHKLL